MSREGLSVGHMLSPNGETSTATGGTTGKSDSGRKTFQASVSGTGLVTATVIIQASHFPDIHGWVDLGTITLAQTTQHSDGFTSESSWPYFRARLTAITGTAAKAYVTCSQE